MFNTLRILHYPKSNEKIKAGIHSDYGSITLLFQDDIGGLEILKKDKWISINNPNESKETFPIIINSGDLMEIWTNKKYPSVKHRVMGTKKNEIQSRYSIAYFCHPDKNCEIETVKSCLSENGKSNFSKVNSFQYLLDKLNNSY